VKSAIRGFVESAVAKCLFFCGLSVIKWAQKVFPVPIVEATINAQTKHYLREEQLARMLLSME